MKRLLAIVLACGLVLPTTAVFAGRDDPVESPTVTSPKGGESWKTGTTRTIKWEEGSGFNFVKIQLLKSGKHYRWVSKKTKNDGKHPWKIPATVATSSAYKVKVTATTNNKLTDTTNKNFTITKTGGGSNSLRVTTPNGGQKWKTGKKYAIKWNKGNAGAYVKIQLLKSGKHSIWISKKTKNDGKYTWTISSSVATGSAYKIKITSRTKKTVTDTSNANFKITKQTQCTNFHVDSWYPTENSNPGVGKQRVANLSGTKKAWLTLNCPYALWYYSSGQWHNYYNDWSYQDTGAALCVGNKVTYSDPKYEDNVCTITDVDNLN